MSMDFPDSTCSSCPVSLTRSPMPFLVSGHVTRPASTLARQNQWHTERCCQDEHDAEPSLGNDGYLTSMPDGWIPFAVTFDGEHVGLFGMGESNTSIKNPFVVIGLNRKNEPWTLKSDIRIDMDSHVASFTTGAALLPSDLNGHYGIRLNGTICQIRISSTDKMIDVICGIACAKGAN